MITPLPAPSVTPDNEFSRPGGVVNCVVYDTAGQRRDVALEAISDVLALDDGSFVWVGLYEPDVRILDQLQEEFGLHDLAVEDAHHAHQRPKIEAYGDSLFVAVQTAQVVDAHILYGETHAFLGARYLITVRHGASLSYSPVRERVQREPALLAMGPSFGLYAVLDFVVDNYRPIVDDFQRQLDALEKDIFSEDFRRPTVSRLYELKRELTQLRMSVAPLQDVLAQLARMQGELVPAEVRLYFRDVHDHALRVNESTDTLRDMLGTAISVNLMMVTLAQGETVKRLGAWAALLAAPTLIASWYGMNFAHMPELHGRYAYPLLAGVVLATCVVLYRLFKRARWL